MIAALYVETDGHYFGVPGVDPWDIRRDATLYLGPDPVVAHPPCTRWCKLAPLVESKGGPKKWEDGGVFARALAQVRAYGGVLEHPASTKAWPMHDMIRPPKAGRGWGEQDDWGGRSCQVDQSQYGHLIRKSTWLYAVGQAALPELVWAPRKGVRTMSGKGRLKELEKGKAIKLEITRKQRKATPPAFRDLLLALARDAR